MVKINNQKYNIVLIISSIIFVISITACSQKKEIIYVNPDDSSLIETFSNLDQLTKKSDVEIVLKDGVYYLEKELQMNPDQLNNRQVIIRAENEGKAILSGAVKLDLLWEKSANGVFVATIHNSKNLDIDELYVNGKYYRMARFPNYNPEAKFFGGTSGEAINPEKVAGWSNPVGGYMHALHRGLWGSKHYQITSVSETNELEFRGGWQENRAGGWDENYRGGFHKDYLFVENIAEELNQPGEWFLNKETGELFVIPLQGDDLQNATVEGAKLVQLISFIGNENNPVANVTFQGITFQHTKRIFMEPYERLLRGDWSISRTAALFIQGAENVTIKDCFFENLGGNAVFVNNYNNNIQITDNYFSDLGESAICFVGDVNAVRSAAISYENTLPQNEIDLTTGPKTNNYPRNCLATGNLITKIGRVGKQVAGVFISQAEEITASNNSIYNVPRAAICINDGCWGGHIIEFNDAFNTVRESGDHGPFNSWGRDRFWQTKHNGAASEETSEQTKKRALLDCYKTVHIRNNRFSHSVDGHSWGIDLDDGTSNYHVYNNLCLGMGIKFREGFFRRAENNIIVNGFGGFHVWFPGSDDVIKNNIWVSDQPYQFIRANPKFAKEIDYNLFYNPHGGLLFTGVGDEMSFEEWQNFGLDQHSISANPLFVDPENGVFTVKPESPALKLGFKNFEMGNWGVTKPAFKEIVKSVERDYNYSRDFDRSFAVFKNNHRNTGKYKWMGAVVKNLAGEAEKSAAGLTDETGVLILNSPSSNDLEKSMIVSGAVILELNGEKIHTIKDLEFLCKKYKNQEVELKLFKGEIINTKVVLSEKSDLEKI